MDGSMSVSAVGEPRCESVSIGHSHQLDFRYS
jgi:hypothetical protein